MKEEERYARQKLLWGKDGQDRLMHARVSVVGLDRQGVYAALCLTALGVGHVSLIDGGKVAKDEMFLGLPVPRGERAESYRQMLSLVNPQVTVEGYAADLESRIDQDLLHGSRVIIDATNSIRSKTLAASYGWEMGIPVLSSSSKWGYTKTMLCDSNTRDSAVLMPMFEGFPQDELMAILTCGVIAEEARKHIFGEREQFLAQPVRYSLGGGRRFSHPDADSPLPDPSRYQNLSIAFLGAGALGCWGAIAAAAMHFGRVDVYDYDKFEPHNIHRQVLGIDGIGRLKAPHISEKMVTMSHGETQSEGFNVKILPGFETKREYDLVFDFVDNAYTRALNTAYAIAHGIPMISAGALPYSARSITQAPGITSCLNCIYDIYEEGRKQEMIRRASCAANPNPSVVMSNAVGAAMALLDVFPLVEPEKYGSPFNGELTYRSTTRSRFGTNPLKDPCDCYSQKLQPNLEISDDDVQQFAQEHGDLLRVG